MKIDREHDEKKQRSALLYYDGANIDETITYCLNVCEVLRFMRLELEREAEMYKWTKVSKKRRDEVLRKTLRSVSGILKRAGVLAQDTSVEWTHTQEALRIMELFGLKVPIRSIAPKVRKPIKKAQNE